MLNADLKQQLQQLLELRKATLNSSLALAQMINQKNLKSY